jgi:hypothetical protein
MNGCFQIPPRRDYNRHDESIDELLPFGCKASHPPCGWWLNQTKISLTSLDNFGIKTNILIISKGVIYADL